MNQLAKIQSAIIGLFYPLTTQHEQDETDGSRLS